MGEVFKNFLSNNKNSIVNNQFNLCKNILVFLPNSMTPFKFLCTRFNKIRAFSTNKFFVNKFQ